MTDAVLETLRQQMGEVREAIDDLREDLYGDVRRRREGLFERAELLKVRQDEHSELLNAIMRREDEREKREAECEAQRKKEAERRARAGNILLGIITTILTLFAVAWINQTFLGIG
jgi:uncharacterized protein involved in exopolysaccharide biosynthesis